MSEHFEYWSIAELLEAFRSKALSPVEVIERVLGRISTYNGAINAFSLVDENEAKAAAQRSSDRWMNGSPLGLLDGVPFSVKGTLMVAGYPFRRGSCSTANDPADETAPIVGNALEHGAILLGITTTPEFGLGPVTISPLTGVTRNPWDVSKTSGGSSGGAAAAVSAGIGQFALGTDAGGSIRIPSALCGTVGMKPTGGLIATYPPNVAGTMMSPAPLARSTKDIRLLMNALAGTDMRDPDAFPDGAKDYVENSSGGIAGVHIGYSETLGYAKNVDPEVAALTKRAALHFESLGAIVEEAHPGFENPIKTYLDLFHAGIAYSLRGLSARDAERLGDNVRRAIASGRAVSLTDYLSAQDQRRLLARTMAAYHQRYDLLITPTVSVAAFNAEYSSPENSTDPVGSRAWTPFCYPFNLTQQPALSIPCGLTRGGLPVGLHIVAPRYGDRALLQAAEAFETTYSTTMGRPPLGEIAGA